MKKESWQLWMILAVGAWLGAGLGAGETAEATELWSGSLRSTSAEGVQCVALNIGNRSGIFSRVAIRFTDNGETCNDHVEILDPEDDSGVRCFDTADTYCVVTGNFTKDEIRAKFSTKDGGRFDRAIIELE